VEVRRTVRVGVRVGVRELTSVALGSAVFSAGVMVEDGCVRAGVAVLLGNGQNDPGTSPGELASL
jgi:hypothetical protein